MRAAIAILGAAATCLAAAAGCGGGSGAAVVADGSRTAGPFVQEAAEDFRVENPDAEIEVDLSRSGRGFDRFCAEDIDIANASRPIDEDEAETCAEADIEYVELQIASDALTVAIHKPILYDWVTCLTVEQLRKIWEPGSQVSNWNQVDPSFPDVPLELYGAEADSGTFNYFTFVINGDRGASRTDYSATEDDNDTAAGVADDKGALGYFGFTYYLENQDGLTALEIDGGDGCVAPSIENVQNGTYKPLARPLFIYVKKSSLDDNEILREFVRHVLENEQRIAQKARFVPLTQEQVERQLRKLDDALR